MKKETARKIGYALIVLAVIVVGIVGWKKYKAHTRRICNTPQLQQCIFHRTKPYRAKILSHDPFILRIPHFLSLDECRQIIQAAEQKKFQRSTVVTTTRPSVDGARTSSTVMFDKHEFPWLQRIEERISYITNTPQNHQEGLQVCRYKPGQEYKAHYDYFVPQAHGTAEATKQGGQRLITIFVYLNDVRPSHRSPEDKKDGCTHFPELDLAIQPQAGTGVLWFNVLPSGQEDPRTLHAGTPPPPGTIKYGLNIWIRERVF